MTSDSSKVVTDGYNQIAENYLSWTSGSPTRLRWLGTLAAMLPPSARVLDLGCGAAVPIASFLSDFGHRLTGIDGSAQQIALARANEPRGEFILADMTKIDFAPESFDAVTAFYSITHVPRDQHVQLLENVCRWLKPGGILLASLGHDDTPSWTGEWLGTTMHFSHFDAATNRSLVEEAGLSIETSEIVSDEEDGRLIPFLWVAARKLGRR